MEILQFLKIKKIIIFIVILGFIPLTIYVFSAKTLTVSDETQLSYGDLLNQINSGFILDKRKSCSLQEAILYKEYCFTYCKINQNCVIVNSSKGCLTGSVQLSFENKRYCAQQNVKNELVKNTNTNIELNLNQQFPPLYSIQTETSMTYYVFNGDLNNSKPGQCKRITAILGSNIQNDDKMQLNAYLMCLQWIYYILIPIFACTFTSALIQTFTRYDCRRVLQIFLFNSSVISASLIAIGVYFDIKCRQFEDLIKWVGQNCLIKGSYAESYKNNLSIDLTNGLSTGFTIIIGIVGILQGFLIIALTIIWLIQIKMQKLRKQDYSSGYELQTV